MFEDSDFEYNLLFVKPLEDPKKTTDVILEALKDTGQRGILDRGWGDLGNCKFIFSNLQIKFELFFSHFISLEIVSSLPFFDFCTFAFLNIGLENIAIAG